ncbi:aromatic ring-hydroxylating dioxygenase subunit alpha [soil metagenome]
MTEAFLRNVWYPLAWEREIGSGPHAAKLLGKRVVVYRRSDGSYAGLDDACPHRKTPLSLGRVHGDFIECGYHGLTFDSAGSCVKAPTNGSIPPGAVVRSYPVHARYGLVWIWMGDAAADAATIFEVEHWDDPAWGTTTGDDMVVDCNYLYITDNLLDPSHVAWVHVSSFAGEGADETPMEITVADDGITTWRWILDSPAAPFYAPYLEFEGNCDRKQHYEVRYPSLALIKAYFCPAGTGGEDRDLPPATFIMDSYNFLTPIDEHTTRYFWFQQRNVSPDDNEVSRRFAASVRGAFEEDKAILTAMQRGMDESTTPTINLRSDASGVRFRRRLSQLIEAEQNS